MSDATPQNDAGREPFNNGESLVAMAHQDRQQRERIAALEAEVERLREAEAVLEALVATTDLRNAPQTVKDRIGEVIRAKHA